MKLRMHMSVGTCVIINSKCRRRGRRFGNFLLLERILDSQSVIIICKEDISRGGKTTKTFNTTNLTYHLKTEHDQEFIEYSSLLAEANERSSSKEGETQSLKQLTLVESSDRST